MEGSKRGGESSHCSPGWKEHTLGTLTNPAACDGKPPPSLCTECSSLTSDSISTINIPTSAEQPVPNSHFLLTNCSLIRKLPPPSSSNTRVHTHTERIRKGRKCLPKTGENIREQKETQKKKKKKSPAICLEGQLFPQQKNQLETPPWSHHNEAPRRNY